MTEDEFILATNLEDIKISIYAIGEVAPRLIGLSIEDKQTIMKILYKAEKDVRDKIIILPRG